MSEDLRQTIRSILIEELAAQGVDPSAPAEPKVREETVSISNDNELSRFVRRLLRMAKDDRARADIESGRYVFRLADGVRSHAGAAVTTGSPAYPRTASKQVATFERGLITEKQVHNLTDNVTLVEAAKTVRFTPLAMDAIRHRGIKVKRINT